MTCESLEYPPGVRAPVAKLRGVQIVNGGQTSNALFEAYREDSEALGRVLILLRIYELKNKEVASRIAESTNSQTPIRSRDLRANDEVQRKIEVALMSKGYYYERKADQYKDKPKKTRLDALAAAQSYVAYFKAWPEVATKDRGKIFGELYDAIFNDELTADHLLSASGVFAEVFTYKRNIERAIRNGDRFDAKRLFLIDGAYYVLYAIARLADQRGIDRLDTAGAAALLPKALQLVGNVVDTEMKVDKAFAHKRFFKSARARQLIDDASRRKRQEHHNKSLQQSP